MRALSVTVRQIGVATATGTVFAAGVITTILVVTVSVVNVVVDKGAAAVTVDVKGTCVVVGTMLVVVVVQLYSCT